MSLCPKCNSKLIIIDSGRDHIVKCPKCNYEVVTTSSNKMDFDATQYEILVTDENEISITNVKFISKIFGCNYVEAKKVLKEGKLLSKGYAIEIISKRDLLEQNQINYKIVPNFPY